MHERREVDFGLRWHDRGRTVNERCEVDADLRRIHDTVHERREVDLSFRRCDSLDAD